MSSLAGTQTGRPAVARPTIARSTAVMSASTALSRVTGFVRTWAIAFALGRTLIASSYAVANNIPNMIFELVAGGIVSSLFIPIFLERWERDSREDAWEFASTIFNLVTLALSVVAIVGTIWAEPFVRTQTFRISAEEASLATYFFRFFAVQVVFYGAGAVINALLNSQRRYFWPAVAPVFNNLVVIVTLLGFYVPFRDSAPEVAKAGLAIGTSLGVLAMVIIPLPALLRMKPQYSFRINLRHPALRVMGRMAVPTVLYVITNLVAVSFRNAYALQVSLEGPATLMYAWMFYQLPYGVLGVALATAVFTELSDQAGKEDWSAFKTTFLRGFRATGLLIIPMAAMLVALAEPLTNLYQAGQFTAEDVPAVVAILRWWGVALFFYAASMFVLKTFYSLKDTRTPMIVNAFLTVIQVALYASLTVGAAGWTGLGLIGIPITDIVFYALILAALLMILRRRVGQIGGREILASLLRVIAAALVGGGVAYGLRVATGPLRELPAGFLAQLAICGILGLVVTYGVAAALGVHEVAEGYRALRTMPARLRGR